MIDLWVTTDQTGECELGKEAVASNGGYILTLIWLVTCVKISRIYFSFGAKKTYLHIIILIFFLIITSILNYLRKKIYVTDNNIVGY